MYLGASASKLAFLSVRHDVDQWYFNAVLTIQDIQAFKNKHKPSRISRMPCMV